MTWGIKYGDFSRHMYVLAGTGSGKTSLIRVIAKALEDANGRGSFQNSFIYVDPKGPDSFEFLKQVVNLSPQSVTFLDPHLTGFAINLLELPKCADEEKERVRSIYMGFVLKLIEEWYGSTPETAPRMLRIFSSLLTYLYAITDAPTLIDLHHLVLRLQDRDEKEKVVSEMQMVLPAEAEALKREMEAIAGLKSEAFDPVLTRLSQFVLDPFLRKIFCVRHSTVDFARMLKPGQITILRASPDIGHHIAPLVRAMFVLKLWFAVQEREATAPADQLTQVVCALDEFQDVQKLEAIQTILSQARSAKLGLILSHQSMAQLDNQLLKIILGNAGTLMFGRVGPDDAAKLQYIDPVFAKEIGLSLVTQPNGRWVVRKLPDFGQEAMPPMQRKTNPPPSALHSDEEVQAFVRTMREMYGTVTVDESIFARKEGETEPDPWLEFMPTGKAMPSKEAWWLLNALDGAGKANYTKLCELTGLPRKDETKAVVEDMRMKKWVRVLSTHMSGAELVRVYGLSDGGKEMLACDFGAIGGSKDVPEIAARAREYYVSHRMFFTVGRQDRDMPRKPDAVVYDYDKQRPIEVEIESPNHVQTHGEQLKAHLLQIEPFAELHVWIKEESAEKVKELIGQLPEDQVAKIRVFTV